jgi:hypothetical protein
MKTVSSTVSSKMGSVIVLGMVGHGIRQKLPVGSSLNDPHDPNTRRIFYDAEPALKLNDRMNTTTDKNKNVVCDRARKGHSSVARSFTAE